MHAWQALLEVAQQCSGKRQDPVAQLTAAQLQNPGVAKQMITTRRVFNQLFETYGTHYITELNLGGKAVFEKTMKKKTLTQVRGVCSHLLSDVVREIFG